MPNQIQLHDVVALMEDVPATHFLTHEPLQLRRGQMGTVVMPLDNNHFQVEFSDREGRASIDGGILSRICRLISPE